MDSMQYRVDPSRFVTDEMRLDLDFREIMYQMTGAREYAPPELNETARANVNRQRVERGLTPYVWPTHESLNEIYVDICHRYYCGVHLEIKQFIENVYGSQSDEYKHELANTFTDAILYRSAKVRYYDTAKDIVFHENSNMDYIRGPKFYLRVLERGLYSPPAIDLATYLLRKEYIYQNSANILVVFTPNPIELTYLCAVINRTTATSIHQLNLRPRTSTQTDMESVYTHYRSRE